MHTQCRRIIKNLYEHGCKRVFILNGIKILEIYTSRTNVKKYILKKISIKVFGIEFGTLCRKSLRYIRFQNVQKTVYTSMCSTCGRFNTGIRCVQTFADTSVCLSFHPLGQRDTEHDLVSAC